MHRLLQNLKITVGEGIYIKDPESSDLGRRIVETAILLIDEIGFDNFTFKKLGARIGSNESSIYRYFENKHKLLIYLTSWYWGWLEYQLVFATSNIEDGVLCLKKAIDVTTRTVVEDSAFTHINEIVLHRIVVNENSKSFLTKEVDKENKQGYFAIYKRLANRIKDMIIAVNGKYPFAATLASTLLDGGLHQHFLKDHFTSLTDCDEHVAPTDFYTHLFLNTLNLKTDG